MNEVSQHHSKAPVVVGAAFALLGVALGAFGAHALKDVLAVRGSTETWKTAVDYQMWHALALILAGMPGGRTRAAWFFGVGILLFSGSLYGLALGGPAWLGPVTPLGGISFMVGWAWLAIATYRNH